MNPLAIDQPRAVTDIYRAVMSYLGGPAVSNKTPETPMQVHDLLVKGLPGSTVLVLQAKVKALKDPVALQAAVGFTRRTSQRKTANKAVTSVLNEAQSGRVWQFAETLAKATSVFGDQQRAEDWLFERTLSLDNQRPVDLLATPTGAKLVEDLLVRLDYGVYQ